MSIHCLLFLQDVDPRGLHSSPTRRSSDLATSAHSVAIGRGDALLVRTGQMAMCRARGGWGDYAGGDAPGLSFWTAEWIHRRELAALATDTWGMEVRPNEIPDSYQALHRVRSANMGLRAGGDLDTRTVHHDFWG